MASPSQGSNEGSLPDNNGDLRASQPEPNVNGATSQPAGPAPRQRLTSSGASGASEMSLTSPVVATPEVPVSRVSASRDGRRHATPAKPTEALGPADPWRRLTRWWEQRRSVRERRREQEEAQSTIVVARDDDLATICGKLDTARRARIVVMVPKGNYELSRPLGVRLLRRHAVLTGKEIVLVTRNFAVRQRAHAERLPYTGSARRVRFGRRSASTLQLGGLDLALPGFGALVTAAALCIFLAAAYVALFWYLPVATVTLYPRSTIETVEQSLTLDAQTTRLNTSGMVVPAARRQTTVTRTVFIPVSGSVTKDPGGTFPAVSERDIKLAQDLAPTALSEQAAAELRARYSGAETLFPESSQIQVLAVDTRQKAGDTVPFLEVTYRGSASMLAAKTEDLHQLFAGLLRSRVGSDQELIDSSFRIAVLAAGPYDKSVEKLPAQMQSQVHVTQALNKSSLRSALRGRSQRQARAYLDRTLSPARPSDLKLSPGWMPWLPRTTQHIHIEPRAVDAPQ